MPVSVFSLWSLFQRLAVFTVQPNKSVSPSDNLFRETMFFIKIRANSKLISAVLLLESQSEVQDWNWRFDERTWSELIWKRSCGNKINHWWWNTGGELGPHFSWENLAISHCRGASPSHCCATRLQTGSWPSLIRGIQDERVCVVGTGGHSRERENVPGASVWLGRTLNYLNCSSFKTAFLSCKWDILHTIRDLCFSP